MKTRGLPWFPTQGIASLPRARLVLDLHESRSEIAKDRFEGLLDEMVVFAIRLQEQAGEKKFHRVATKRIEAGDPVFTADAEFLAKTTDRVQKFAPPSPFLVAIRYWLEDYSKAVYPTVEHLMDDLTNILDAEARALEQAGVRVIQLDYPALTYFCDCRLMQAGGTHDDRLRQTWDPVRQTGKAVECINRIFEGPGGRPNQPRGRLSGHGRSVRPRVAFRQRGGWHGSHRRPRRTNSSGRRGSFACSRGREAN